jgi:gliding motility-associated-like protein
MTRPLYLSFVFLLIVISANAQYSWYYEFEGKKSTEAFKLCIDKNDNLYTVGNYEDDLSIQNSAYHGGGSFLAKFDTHGNAVWHKIVTHPPGNYADMVLVKADDSGNVYVAGYYQTEANFGTQILHGDGYSSFLAKYSSEGILLWTKNYSGLQEIFDMNVNSLGDVIIYSTTWGSITLDQVTLQTNSNSFVALYATNGDLIWTRVVGDNSTINSNLPVSAAIDDNRNIYLNGRFKETLKLDSFEETSSGYYDMFITKFNSTGVCEWLQIASRKVDPLYESWNTIVEYGDMTVDGLGNLFVAGAYFTELSIGNFELKGDPSFSYNENIFTTCLSSQGVVKWINGFTDPQNTLAENVFVKNNKLYASGTIGYDHYFAILNPAAGGEIIPTRMPIEYADIANGLAVDSQDSLYMSGRRRPLSNVYAGYLFKYNGKEPLTIGTGSILAPTAICFNTNEVLIKTSPIQNASSYEWEITFKGQSFKIITTEPSLDLSLIDYGITGSFSVRVRGKNGSFVGEYTNTTTTTLVSPIESLVIKADCKSISFNGEAPFYWYRNETPYPDNKKHIQPNIEGNYFVSKSNECGTFESNKITFAPLNSHTLFIPNIITPNNDDTNQHFIIDAKLEEPTLQIINRWGKEVYHTTSYQNNWDGDDLAQGVYYYIIKSECLTESLKGPLTIKR